MAKMFGEIVRETLERMAVDAEMERIAEAQRLALNFRRCQAALIEAIKGNSNEAVHVKALQMQDASRLHEAFIERRKREAVEQCHARMEAARRAAE